MILSASRLAGGPVGYAHSHRPNAPPVRAFDPELAAGGGRRRPGPGAALPLTAGCATMDGSRRSVPNPSFAVAADVPGANETTEEECPPAAPDGPASPPPTIPAAVDNDDEPAAPNPAARAEPLPPVPGRLEPVSRASPSSSSSSSDRDSDDDALLLRFRTEAARPLRLLRLLPAVPYLLWYCCWLPCWSALPSSRSPTLGSLSRDGDDVAKSRRRWGMAVVYVFYVAVPV